MEKLRLEDSAGHSTTNCHLLKFRFHGVFVIFIILLKFRFHGVFVIFIILLKFRFHGIFVIFIILLKFRFHLTCNIHSLASIVHECHSTCKFSMSCRREKIEREYIENQKLVFIHDKNNTMYSLNITAMHMYPQFKFTEFSLFLFLFK